MIGFRIKTVPCFLLLTIFFCPPAFSQSFPATGNLNLYIGGKALDKDEWDPAHGHGEIALKLDLRPVSWPINLALDFRGSASKEEADLDPSLGANKFEVETSELNLGFRKIWEDNHLIRPFVEGGLSLAKVKATRTFPVSGSLSEMDKGLGLWIGGGVYWTLFNHLNLGFELMVSTAETKIAGKEVDAGGGHFGLLAGYHWGGSSGGSE